MTAAPPTGTTYTFDAENHLTAAGGQAYLYDGDGKRVGKAPSGTPTQPNYIYWYGTSSAPLEESDGAGNLLFRDYYFNGMRVARVEGDNWVDHFGLDALGNTRVVYGDSDPDGGWSDYYPFGGERPISPATGVGVPFKFTGKERDPESGLDNFGARFDSSSVGRFMSPDPLYLEFHRLTDPQVLNLYSYVRNNPLNLTDPSGLDVALRCQDHPQSCTDTVKDLNNRDGKQFDVDLGKDGLLTVVGDVNRDDLSVSEQALYDAIKDTNNHATLNIVEKDDSVNFGRFDGNGQNTLDRSDMNLLNKQDKKLAGDVVAHESLEAYANARWRVDYGGPLGAHAFASNFFEGAVIGRRDMTS